MSIQKLKLESHTLHPILVNQWMTPDGTILRSRHRHDHVSHADKNGKLYFVDGGTSYFRYSLQDPPLVFCGCHTNDLHSVIREIFDWGSYGISGGMPLQYIILKDMTEDHICAILRTQGHIVGTPVEKVLLDELEYRKGI